MMTQRVFSSFSMNGAMVRAITSVPPPGEAAAMTVIGFPPGKFTLAGAGVAAEAVGCP